MSKNIYIFSGLGADERAFQRLVFPGFTPHFIKWEKPGKEESLEQYSGRLTKQITCKNPVLIGLSFGGIVAAEVARQIKTEHLILIATAKTKKEIPFYYRWPGTLGLHKLLPAKLLMQPGFLTNWLFSISSAADKKILKDILEDTDSDFFSWAIDTITTWSNITFPHKYTHIHGTADRIFPVAFVSCDIRVDNGGHFMTIDKSDELNKILKQVLNAL